MFGLVQDRLQKNIDAVNRIVGTRSVQDFVAVQSDLARDTLQQVMTPTSALPSCHCVRLMRRPGPSRLRITPIRVAAPRNSDTL